MSSAAFLRFIPFSMGFGGTLYVAHQTFVVRLEENHLKHMELLAQVEANIAAHCTDVDKRITALERRK